MAVMRKLCSSFAALAPILLSMLRTEPAYTRTLTLVLPESEWRALRDAEPDAVGWLHSQIRSRLEPVGKGAHAHRDLPVTAEDEY